MRVRSYPRLHTVLLDLGNATNRKYGGAGFVLSGPYLEIEIKLSERNQIADDNYMDQREKDDIDYVVNKLGKYSQDKYYIKIHKIPPRHIGLGSKTSLLLSIIKGIQELSNIDLSDRDIIEISGRGGTSGIGVNGFFQGGFIVDCGQDPNNDDTFVPSSVNRKRNVPPIICRHDITSNWKFLLFLPKGKRFEGQSEVEFFEQNSPLGEIDVLRNLASVYHGLAPAVVLSDINLLRKALNEIHAIGFTSHILREQSYSAKKFYNCVKQKENCAIGISSMGPLLYVIINKNDNSVEKSIMEISKQYSCPLVGGYSGHNKSFEIV